MFTRVLLAFIRLYHDKQFIGVASIINKLNSLPFDDYDEQLFEVSYLKKKIEKKNLKKLNISPGRVHVIYIVRISYNLGFYDILRTGNTQHTHVQRSGKSNGQTKSLHWSEIALACDKWAIWNKNINCFLFFRSYLTTRQHPTKKWNASW